MDGQLNTQVNHDQVFRVETNKKQLSSLQVIIIYKYISVLHFFFRFAQNIINTFLLLPIASFLTKVPLPSSIHTIRLSSCFTK